MIVEGTCGQVACAVGVDGAEVRVSERSKAEDVGVDWRIFEWLGVVLVFWMEPHASLGCGGGLGEVFANCLGVEDWACVEKSQMCGPEEGLNWWAEEGFVHVFYPVLDVCDCVDVVSLMWCDGCG